MDRGINPSSAGLGSGMNLFLFINPFFHLFDIFGSVTPTPFSSVFFLETFATYGHLLPVTACGAIRSMERFYTKEKEGK